VQIDLLGIDVGQDQGHLLSPFGSGSLELGFSASQRGPAQDLFLIIR
jgi:hypothetical protein